MDVGAGSAAPADASTPADPRLLSGAHYWSMTAEQGAKGGPWTLKDGGMTIADKNRDRTIAEARVALDKGNYKEARQWLLKGQLDPFGRPGDDKFSKMLDEVNLREEDKDLRRQKAALKKLKIG